MDEWGLTAVQALLEIQKDGPRPLEIPHVRRWLCRASTWKIDGTEENGRMRVAAYQAPLLPPGCMDAIELIRMQIRRCEIERIRILCCPEAVLGGLADNHPHPSRFAIATDTDMLRYRLLPLASDTVTSIVGFSELVDGGRLYNSAAVFQRGEIAGLYRKLYPAIRRSVYSPGHDVPVFRIEELSFGIVICNDSNYPELARLMAEQGATALFVPTNNGLSPKSASAELVAWARKRDIATAVENNMWVIRADVAGNAGGLVSFGSSAIVAPEGIVVESARQMSEDLVVADIDTIPHVRQRGKNTSRRHPSAMYSGGDSRSC